MGDDFNPNSKDGRHIVAAILTAGYAPILLKKDPKNIEIKHVVDLYWDFANLLRKGGPTK